MSARVLRGARPFGACSKLAAVVAFLCAALNGCAGQLAPSTVVVVWEDAGGSEEGFREDCRRCREFVQSESLAQDFEDPLFRSSGAERYARARAWGRAALRDCLVDADYAVRLAPASEAPSEARMCTIENVVYPP